jgi:hypothetical protein
VRGWVKGSIAVLGLALVCAVTAPGASGLEESEVVYLEVTPRKEVRVWLEVRPLVGVAVLKTWIGVSKHGGWRPRNGIVGYAARIPEGPLEGKLDVQIPGVASIVGELTPAAEGLEFIGSFQFTGNGGYLRFESDHAAGRVLRGEEAACDGCHKVHPDLFEYIADPFHFSNSNVGILFSELRSEGRASSFQATNFRYGAGAGFQAQTLEWLPGHVAVNRTVELEKTFGAAFKVGSKAEHPKSATVRPPAPFSGSAVYHSGGSVRSPAGGKLTGSLSVDLFGVKVPLAGPSAKASLINFSPDL